jgi:hypothetical protein
VKQASEPKGRGVTVTIKYGAGYDQTWVSFSGLVNEVREDIAAFFGIDCETDTGLVASDLVINATTTAHAVAHVATTLGGTVVESQPRPPAAAAQPVNNNPANDGRPDPWTQAAQPDDTRAAAAGNEPNPVLGLIDKVPDLRALERLWADNQAAFADPAVLAAWKAKGRALQAQPIPVRN